MLNDKPSWFSCRIRFIHYSRNDPSYLIRVSSYLFRAHSYEDAMPRALEIGGREERVFRNADGGMSRTAMVEVDAIDILDDIADGVEVASLWSEDLDSCPYSFDHRFTPEDSCPTQSL